MSGSNRAVELRRFPADVLNRVSHFLDEDELFKLFLSGDRAFLARLRQISTITAVWKSSTPCGWNRLSSFIHAFPHLHTITIRLESQHHEPKEPFNVAFLPLNLASLSLEFHGALDCLASKTAFKPLHSLTHLSIVQKSSTPTNLSVDMTQFPASLLSLQLSNNGQPTPSYDAEKLLLPADLTSLDLNMPPRMSHPDKCVVRIQNTHLKHLSLQGFYLHSFAVDITNVASELESLRAPQLCLLDMPIDRITQTYGTPLRNIFPRLHTLILTAPPYIPWTIMQTLPPSITKLGGSFDMRTDAIAVAIQVCRQLNDLHLSAKETGQACFLPKNVTDLVLRDHESLKDMLPFFTSLKNYSAPYVTGTIELKDLPRTIQKVSANRVAGPVAEIPPHLTSLSCDILVINDFKQEKPSNSSLMDLQVPSKLSHLLHFSVQSSRLTHAIVSLLPDTLQTIDVVIVTPDVLEALTNKFNGSTFLRSLRIKVPYVEPEDRRGDIIIGSRTIPNGIKTLQLVGNYFFAPPLSTDSLRSHPNLTSLKSASPEHPTTILPLLPRQLFRLVCVLSRSVDLNDDFMLETALNFPPSLRELRISFVGFSGISSWFIPATKRLPLRSILPHLLTNGAEFRFRLLRVLPTSWVDEVTLIKANEGFLHARLPRVLSEFGAPFFNHRNQHKPDAKRTPWQGAVEIFTLTSPLEILQRFLFTRFPLIGLLLPSSYRLDERTLFRAPEFTQQISTLPTRIQDLNSGIPELDRAYFDRTRDSSAEAIASSQAFAPERVIFRTIFHSLNLLTWLHFRYFLQLDRHTNPLAWSYAWINILGSALSLPIHLIYFRKHLNIRIDPMRMPEGIELLKVALVWITVGTVITVPSIGFLWTTNFAAAVALDYAPTRWSSLAKAIAGGFLAGSELLIQLITSRLY